MNIEEESPPESTTAMPPPASWKVQHVYLLAIVCLLLGVLLGYLVRGSQSAAPSATASTKTPATADTPRQPRSLEEMKGMADKAAAPLLDKLKKDPNSFEALNEAGKVYRATHQFKEAAGYYERALQVNPKSAATRTDLASCLYYTGDVDGALAQLDKALSYDPQFGSTLASPRHSRIPICRIRAVVAAALFSEGPELLE